MFEGMLARKYISSQKRHSALTICSIAMALALITMLFSAFSTVMSCMRNFAHEYGTYHIQIGFDSREKYDAFEREVSDYASCTLDEYAYPDGTEYFTKVLFNRNIGTSIELFLENVNQNIGYTRYFKNGLLIFCDMVDIQSVTYMIVIFALFYVFVLFIIMMLRLIIDTAFEISSKERERQFGVLQSIGATPRQIVRIITVEGLILSVIGIPLGVGLGIGLGWALFRAVLSTGVADLFLSKALAAKLIHFYVDPRLLLLGVVTGAAWVFFSAYGTGMRVIRMSPVQAISQRSDTVKKVRRASLFGKIFGWTGKIASRNNMRQPKRFIATVIALTLSISLFSAVTVVTDSLYARVDEKYKDYASRNGDFLVFHNGGVYDLLAQSRQMKILEESGLFSKLYFEIQHYGRYYDGSDDHVWIPDSQVLYLSRDMYLIQFGGNPPVSYDELTQSGGYLLGGKAEDEADPPDSISIEYIHSQRLTEEEYNELSEKEKQYVSELNGIYVYDHRYHSEFDVFMVTHLGIRGEYALIGTLDQYNNGEYKKFRSLNIFSGIACMLRSADDYPRALAFMEQTFAENEFEDNSAEMRQWRSVLASANIGTAFICVLIALIAVVNMVNILSTGILNRRGELAAMQCAGMTERQLYKMTIIECLQYALSSGIGAVAVCELLLFLTDKMLHLFIDVINFPLDFISYVRPLPIIGTATLCAFIIAIAASIIPLRAMRKTSLVEQIRSVE